MKNNFFDMQRFINTLKIDCSAYKKTAIFLLFLFMLMSTSPASSVSHEVFHLAWYMTLFGVIYTSSVFVGIHKTHIAQSYLMLPCSNFERWLSRWLITSFGVVILFTVAAVIGYSLSYLLWGVWLGGHVASPLFFTSSYLGSVLQYLAIQSLFFFGAIYFKSNALIKTAASAVAIAILANIVVIGMFLMSIVHGVEPGKQLIEVVFQLKNIMLYSAAPIALYLSYLRLTESEL